MAVNGKLEFTDGKGGGRAQLKEDGVVAFGDIEDLRLAPSRRAAIRHLRVLGLHGDSRGRHRDVRIEPAQNRHHQPRCLDDDQRWV